MNTSPVDWEELESLAARLTDPELGPGGASSSEWGLIRDSLNALKAREDWRGVIRLRELFNFLVVGETTGGMQLVDLNVQDLDEAAIDAASQLGERRLVADFQYSSGENYHRQGYHEKSIEAFEQAADIYESEGEVRRAFESRYFSSLPYRAIGRIDKAREILGQTLEGLSEDDPWRANPLHVLSWIERDEANFDEAERLLRNVVDLFTQMEGRDSIHVVQALTDLGEVLGLQKRYTEAAPFFEEALEIVETFGGQYHRQEARTKLKYAEALARAGENEKALQLLEEADKRISAYGHYYDLLWRIDLARALIFFNTRQWASMIRRVQLVMRYRRELGLSDWAFLSRFAMRLRVGTGMRD